jgi:hypothetical protein
VADESGFTQIQNATVGQPVNLLASVETANGSYRVYFENTLVDSNVSQGYFVSSNFTIPEVPSGSYIITLTDVAINQNTTLPFPILTSYSVNPIIDSALPHLQENTDVPLNVTITGGLANTSYDAEITVVLPGSEDLNFTRILTLTTSSEGTAQMQITYPDESFSPSGSSTLYAGTYSIYFNASQGLGQNQFKVGFTERILYHRGESVAIRAVGYQPNQGVTSAVSYNNEIVFSEELTASGQGIVTSSWPIPQTAAKGTYTITLTAQTSPSKTISDIQTIELPGYPITFRVLNLAGDLVPQILVEAFDQSANRTYEGTTDFEGVATINLETGSHNVRAFWNEVEVGNITISINGNNTFSISAQLTNLQIKVQSENEVVIPFVNLNITFQYQTRTGINQKGNATGQTNLSGVYLLNSTLPGITYQIAASKFETVFNTTNSAVDVEPTTEVIVICPSELLMLKTVDYNFATLANARVTLIEQASGIFYTVTTDSTGTAQAQVTFGQYRASVYTDDNVLLNETIISVLGDTQSQIRCALYNIDISVKVVDFFGSPINNVNVQLSRPGMSPQVSNTQSNGISIFTNVIGGDIQIVAYPNGNPNAFTAKNLQVNAPTTIEVSMDRYIVLAGSLIEVSTLATIVLVLIVVLLLAGVVFYRRTGFKMLRRS